MGLKYLPLADTTGISFIYPFYCPYFLTRTLQILQPYSLFFGFLGALLIIRPTGVVYVLFASFSISLNILITRKLSASSSATLSLFYTCSIAFVLTSLFVHNFWEFPDGRSIGHLFCMALIGTVRSWLMYTALKYASASTLAPLGYAEIIGATLFGYYFFAEVPQWPTLAGIALIVVSGVYIMISSKR